MPTSGEEHALTVYMEDTGWPHDNRLDDYVTLAGEKYAPGLARSGFLRMEAAFRPAFGTHRRAELVLMQKVLDHDRRVQHVVPVVRWPVTVGRALECDVVLHDPHVAPHHATSDMADAGLTLSVGDSVNGANWGDVELTSGHSAVLPAGSVWSVGRSELRVRLAGEALAPEQPLAHPAQRRHALLTGAASAALLLWVAALLWLDNDPGARWDEYVPLLLGTVFGAAVWCSLWGLGSKLFQRRFSVLPHLRVLLGFALAGLSLVGYLAKARREVVET